MNDKYRIAIESRADWYLRIGFIKAVEDIIISLSALRIILYKKTYNHKKYVNTMNQVFEEAGKLSEEYCK